ncbi:MAG TPA: aminoglycoside phosphotransferase family protein, partial [Devosia sp.]
LPELRKIRDMSQAIGPLLGSGRIAEVFEYGEAAIKLYRDPASRTAAFMEAATLAVVGDHGLPTPQVHEAGRYAGRWGLVMDRAPGKPFARVVQEDAEQVPAMLDAMVDLHLRMHRKPEARLPSLKSRLVNRIGRAPALDDRLRGTLLERLAAMPDGNRLCHGDYHPFNVVGVPGRAMVIDWVDATSGPAEADVCRSFLLMSTVVPELAEDYLERYARTGGLDRTGILAWMPFVAAARLTEGIVEEQSALLRLAAS